MDGDNLQDMVARVRAHGGEGDDRRHGTALCDDLALFVVGWPPVLPSPLFELLSHPLS